MGRKSHIVLGPDPVLATVCAPVGPKEDTSQIQRLMERACKMGKNGVGLAASQIGITKQIIYLNCKDGRGTIRGRWFFNARIAHKSDETTIDKEGCLSYPGIYKWIARPDWIQVEYQRSASDMTVVSERLEGFQARVMCHELDHTNGICLVGDPNFAGEPDLDPVPHLRPNPRAIAAMAGVMGI